MFVVLLNPKNADGRIRRSPVQPNKIYIRRTTGNSLGTFAISTFNDLPSKLQCTACLFADDCLLYVSLVNPSTDVQLLQDDLFKLEEWRNLWQMQFNPKKWSTLWITLKRGLPLMNFRFCGQILENVTSHPYLGVQLDSKLCWKGHIESLVKGASKILGLIRRNFWFCDEKVKTTLYKTMVRPKLEYASSIRT